MSSTWSFCPVCGHRIYQHSNESGCTRVETTGHVLKVTKTQWTLKHPVAERESDKLFQCPFQHEISCWDTTRFPQPGEYALVENDGGGWSFEPASHAREVCECNVLYELLIVQRV